MADGRIRARGRRLRPRGRAALVEWLKASAPAAEEVMGVPCPGKTHARASGIPRTNLQNMLRQPEKRYEEPTISRFCTTIGGGQPADVFFEDGGRLAVAEVVDGSDSNVGRAAIDVLAELASFDHVACAPRLLRSQSRQDRHWFLEVLRTHEPLAECLEREGTPSGRWAAAMYCLTRADQVLISNADARTAVHGAAGWAGRAANGADGSDPALLATCLIHHASILYSCRRFVPAAAVRNRAVEAIDRVADRRVADHLRARFAVDTASQLTAILDFDGAWTWARQAVEVSKGFDDEAWYACARAVSGTVLLARGEPEDAAGELEWAVGRLQGGSKKAPLQRVIFSKYLVLAQRRCGAVAEAAAARQRAERDCDEYGFTRERAELARLLVLDDDPLGSRAR